MRVTTPLRTALDLGCNLPRRDALAAMDALARAHGFSKHDLTQLLGRYRRRRGVVQARELVALVDSRAESQPESWMREVIAAHGLTMPELQHWVAINGVPTYGSISPMSGPRSPSSTTARSFTPHQQTARATRNGGPGCARKAGTSSSSRRDRSRPTPSMRGYGSYARCWPSGPRRTSASDVVCNRHGVPRAHHSMAAGVPLNPCDGQWLPRRGPSSTVWWPSNWWPSAGWSRPCCSSCSCSAWW